MKSEWQGGPRGACVLLTLPATSSPELHLPLTLLPASLGSWSFRPQSRQRHRGARPSHASDPSSLSPPTSHP